MKGKKEETNKIGYTWTKLKGKTSVKNSSLTPSISCHMLQIFFFQCLYPEDGDGVSFLTLVITYQTIRCRNPEDHNVEDLTFF